MYKINFYDDEHKFIASHLISTENCPLEKKNIEDYCLMIAENYPKVYRWTVYEYSGYPTFAGYRS